MKKKKKELVSRMPESLSQAEPEFDRLLADGEAEQRPGARAKVRTPTQLERDDSCSQWTCTVPNLVRALRD